MAGTRRIWRQRASTLLVMGALVGLGVWTFQSMSVTTDITHFLPESDDQQLARIARQMSASDLNRSITFVLDAPDEATAVAASRDLAERLARIDSLEWVRSGPGEDLNEAFYELYYHRRLAFFSDEPSAVAEQRLSDEALRRAARELKQRLVSPTGTFVRQIAPEDPLLAFLHLLDRIRQAQQGELRVSEGQFVTEDGRGVIFTASRFSPFAADDSRRLQAAIEAAIDEVRGRHGAGIEVEQSGVHRFALASESAIRADVTRISIVSSIGVTALFLLLFRSPRYLLLSVVPLAAGFVCGLAVCLLLFGRLHGISLAFGATLIGVGIDYVVHALNHHTLAPAPGGPSESLRRIWPGLALGAATTVAGLAGLAWTGFPGIRELAVLTSVGVLVALLATRYLLPPWLPVAPTPTPLHRWVSSALQDALERLRGSRLLLSIVPALALAGSVAGLAGLRWVDDVRALDTMDPELVAEDERVREAVSRMDAGRFVIAWAGDEETALARNDEVHRRLRVAREAGELDRFRSVHSLLWSAELQRRSAEALRGAPRLWERLSEALRAEGFVPAMFEPFRDALAAEPAPPLTWRELSDSPLGPMVSSFRVEMDGGAVAFVTLTRGADVDALEARLEGLEGVRLFDQGRFLQSAYGTFRARTLEMMAVGLGLVFLMVLARYRRLRLALAAFLPAVLAASTALAALWPFGYEANLMHLVALLLVLSMGVDYGVFMVESRTHEEGTAPTLVSLLVACASTVLSFGLLAMSANPALRALGLVTGVGVLMSLLLAPAAWLLVAADEPRGGSTSGAPGS